MSLFLCFETAGTYSITARVILRKKESQNGMLAIDRNYPSCDSEECFFTGLSIGMNVSPSIYIIFAPPWAKIRIHLWLLSIHINSKIARARNEGISRAA